MKIKRSIYGAVLVAGLALFLALPVKADQVTIPNSLASVSNATLVATDGPALAIVPFHDYGFLISQSAAGTGTSNAIYGFDYQVGTNWTTTTPLKLTLALNGTTNTGGYFYLNQTNFAGVNAIRFSYFSSTQTNIVTPQSIQAGVIH